MKRTGFKPKHPPRPVKRMDSYTPKPRAAAVAIHDGKARMVVQIPKRQYVENKKLREAYRVLPCQFTDNSGSLCGREDGTVACCHANWGVYGKGLAIKADDSRAASGCGRCHHELDQGKNWDAETKWQKWHDAHERSVRLLVSMGLWPEDVPIPI